MVAEELISDSIIPLRTSDSGEEALGIMNDLYVRHLPIVNNEQLLGLISEEDILNHDVKEPVGSYSLSIPHPSVKVDNHIFEVLRLIAEHNLTVIPVVDFKENYVGLISMEGLLQYFSHTGSFTDPGSILVLEVAKQDYSLAEIARIVESENAAVLCTFITSDRDSVRLEVSLKINRQNIQSIIATFQRFDYQIKASFNELDYVESLQERYDSLMSYLNV